MTLPGEVALLSRRVLAGRAQGVDDEIQAHAERLERLSREVEEPAEAAEQAIWAELLAGQRAR